MTDNKGKQVNVRFNQYTIEKINKMIEEGKFPNKSELVRTAVQRLIREEEMEAAYSNKRE